MSRIVLGLLHNYNTFVYSRFFNFNILHSFNNKPRVSLYATPLTREGCAIAARRPLTEADDLGSLTGCCDVLEQRVSVASACSRLVCRLIWRPVAVGGAFLLLISSTSELSQTESVTAKSLVGLSNG